MTDKTTAMPELPDGATVLPDGSAFAIASFPLPANHWLYAPREYRDGEEDPIELPSPILSHQAHGDVVRAAIRYAVRGATMCGKEPDFDPDALVQNAMYALCGPFGGAALQSAQPAAAVSDETIYAVWTQHCQTPGTTTRQLVCAFARAILALRPQAVPMTDEQVDRIWNALPMGNGFWLSFARAVEAHHGITQRADGGEKQA